MRELLRAVFKTGIGSSASMVLSAVSSKLMAAVSGPFGIGLYSLIQQLTQTVSASGLAGGGRTVMAQGIASREGKDRDSFILAAFWILTFGAILASSALILSAPWIAPLIFGSNDGATVGLVRWTALPVVLTIALVYLNGVLNGFMAIGRLAIIQVVGAAANALLSYPISVMVNTGYPVAFVAMTTISLLAQVMVGFSKAYRQGYLHPIVANRFRIRIEKQASRSFFIVAGTFMIGSVVASVCLLSIRALIVQHSGIGEAGIFNVAWVICVVYPTVVLNSFAAYYLPKLSQTKDVQERSDLMNKVFRLTMIIIVPLELLAMVLKPLMINVLYSEEFYPSLLMLRWMIVGIFLRVTAQTFAMPMLSSADMKTFFWTGNLQYISLVGFSLLSIVYYGGLEVIGIGYVAIHGGYMVYSLHYATSKHGYIVQPRLMAAWFVGLALIVAASVSTWHDTSVNMMVTLGFLAAGILYVTLSTTKQERNKTKELLVQALSSKR